MKDKDKTHEQLLKELEALRKQTLANGTLSLDEDGEWLGLADILDVNALQSMMDDFYELTHIGIAILDLHGKVLVATGWQDICTKFHRVHPETRKHCIESDLALSTGVAPGTFKIYKCKNNMWDMVTPIMVGDRHLGNLYLGQFLFADESPDYELFRAQAQRYGFDEEAYLAALDRVPRWSRETVNTVMRFYTQFANLISMLSYSNIELARALAERNELLHSLRQSEAKLREASATKDKFFSIIAHDLKNPFLSVLSGTKMLKDHFQNGEDEFAHRISEELHSSSQRLFKLLENLLSWSRMQQGKVPFKPTAINAYINAQACIRLLQESAAQKHITIINLIKEDTLVYADYAMLSAIFRNLISNAIKFTPEGGEVTLKSKAHGLHQSDVDFIEISVVDNGIGMSEEKVQNLFDIGDKHKSSMGTGGEKGTGLGLILCQEFVERHGGEIWAESQPGQGSTFTFTLPKP